MSPGDGSRPAGDGITMSTDNAHLAPDGDSIPLAPVQPALAAILAVVPIAHWHFTNALGELPDPCPRDALDAAVARVLRPLRWREEGAAAITRALAHLVPGSTSTAMVAVPALEHEIKQLISAAPRPDQRPMWAAWQSRLGRQALI